MNSAPSLRIAFMGTPDFAVAALTALHQAGHSIVVVYCQPPKPVGRGHQIQRNPVHLAAEALGIEVRTPRSLRDAAAQSDFAALKLDVAVVAAYGLILPPAILDAPSYGCLNVHASLLPRWRGAAPIQRAILEGDQETGITIMKMEAGLDTGPMLLKESLAITNHTTSQSLQDDLAKIGGRLVVKALAELTLGSLHATNQCECGATYAHKLTREDGKIDWARPASDIERQFRALFPWPGCFFSLKGEIVKILSLEIIDTPGQPGKLMDNHFTVGCGTQALRLTSVQRPGKKATDGASFLHGLHLPVGSDL